MKKEESVQQKFEKELKSRVLLKTSPSMLPEKVLVDAFKYYDLNGSGRCNAATFLKVLRVRLGLTTTTDAEVAEMFAEYAKGDSELTYKEFVSGLFQSQVGYTITDRMSRKEGVEMPQNRFDLAKHEDSIKKNIDFIIYKLRGNSIGAFFGLYWDLAVNRNSQGEVTSSHFHQALKKSGIDFSADDSQKIFYYVSREKALMSLEDLFDYLLANYSEHRQQQVAAAFAKFDYMFSQKASLQLIKELFSPRNFPGVREGRFTWEELTVQFEKLTNNYSKFNKDSFVISEEQFLHFFGFLSGFIKEDTDFSQFIDSCFRYSELPRGNQGRDTSTRGPHQSKVIEQLSIKNSQVEDLAEVLIQQLNAKGERGYIYFFKVLKCNDFDGDGRVFEREFEKTLHESRLNFSKPQTQRLFEQFATDKKGLKVVDFVDLLVPRFDPDKVKVVADLYNRLAFAQTSTGQVSYDQIASVFNAKLHPDFKKGLRADYEIKAEFEDCLKTFLSLYSGSHLSVTQDSFLRFFEFYGRNWDLPYLEAVLSMAFKVKLPVTRSEFSRPYGTTFDPERPNSGNSNRTGATPGGMGSSSLLDEYRKTESRKAYTPSNLLAHDESPRQTESTWRPDPKANILAHEENFKKKNVEYKVAYPYHTGDEKVSTRLPSDGRSVAHFSRRPIQDTRIEEPLPVQTYETNSQESKKQKSPRSEFNPSKREPLDQSQKNIVNSPEDGSVASPDENFRYTSDLNEHLETTSVRTGPLKVDNEAVLRKKMTDIIRAKGRYELFLDLELQMTEQSDSKGFIDFEIFSSILQNFELTRGYKQSDITAIYISFLFDADKVHVQKFVNSIRGQMTKFQEEASIALYDRITPPDVELHVDDLKAAFLPHKFRFGIYKTTPEAKETFGRMVDLFATLNLAVRNKDTFDLDEFLYFMDNFAFFLSSNDEFGRMTEVSFKSLVN